MTDYTTTTLYFPGAKTSAAEAGSFFGPNAKPIVLLADVGTGTVIVRAKDKDGAWNMVIGTDFSSDGSAVLDVANGPQLRISVTGNAQYWARGG